MILESAKNMANPKWFEKAKPTCSVVPIRRFVNEHVFALKTGGYGCMLAIDGLDDEGLTDEAVADALKRVEDAFKGLPENGRVYQYVRIRKGFDIPAQNAGCNPHVQKAIQDRITFLGENADFRRIELFWALTVEPGNKNSFPSKVISPEQYARQTAMLISQVERAAETFTAQLTDTLGVRLLNKDEVASFFAYLLNLEPWAVQVQLASSERVDQQITRSSIEWHADHLRVGKQHVQLFSLLDSPLNPTRICLARYSASMLTRFSVPPGLCGHVPRCRSESARLKGFPQFSGIRCWRSPRTSKIPKILRSRLGRRPPREERTNSRKYSVLSTTMATSLGCIP
jgi:type IV secretion system protein VirB4